MCLLPARCLSQGSGVCPGGGGCLLPAGSARPHPVDRMTDACENIYFPHLLLRTVEIEGHCLTLNESISISPFDVDGRRLMEGFFPSRHLFLRMCSENRNICYSIKGTAADGFVCVVYFAELELDFIRVSLLSFAEDTANLLISSGLPRFSLFVYIC